MTVKEIIKKLKKFDKNQEVEFGINFTTVAEATNPKQRIEKDELEFIDIIEIDNKIIFHLQDNIREEFPRLFGRR